MTFLARSFDIGCRVEVEHTAEHLHAHVRLDDEVAIEPGDQIRVHGEPIRVMFGSREVFCRTATVTRAAPLRRLFVRLRARFELTELYELSFSSGRIA